MLERLTIPAHTHQAFFGDSWINFHDGGGCGDGGGDGGVNVFSRVYFVCMCECNCVFVLFCYIAQKLKSFHWPEWDICTKFHANFACKWMWVWILGSSQSHKMKVDGERERIGVDGANIRKALLINVSTFYIFTMFLKDLNIIIKDLSSSLFPRLFLFYFLFFRSLSHIHNI